MAADLDRNRACRDSFGDYYTALNTDYTYVSYQQEEIIPALEEVERRDILRLLILIPPGHAKTDLVRNFSAWFIGLNPKSSVLGLSYSMKLALRSSRHVRNRLRHPLHQAIFPESALSTDSHAADTFATAAGGEYYAAGYNGTIFGLRADLLLIDDPLKNQKEARSQAGSRWKFTKGIVKSRLKPGGRIVACTTRLCVGDWAHQLMEEEGDQWTIIKIPAERDGKYLWQEHYGRSYYEQAKKDPESWASIYMQDPGSGFGGLWFAETKLPRYQGNVKPGRFQAYMIVDPGLSKHHSADPTSIMVLCTTPEKKVLLADWNLDHMDPDERTIAIIRLVKKWKPVKLVYEEYGLVSDSFHLGNAFKEAGIHIKPIPVGRRGPRHMLSTQERIRGLIPTFRDQTIVIPEKMERRLLSGETRDLAKYFFEEEYLLYAGEDSILHDEGLDCLSRIHDPETNLKFPDVPTNDDDEEVNSCTLWSGGRRPLSWQSA